jgi:hypothetical protein
MHGIVSIGTLCRTVQMAADVERRGGGGLRVDDSDRPTDEQDDIGEEELQRRYYERLSDGPNRGNQDQSGRGAGGTARRAGLGRVADALILIRGGCGYAANPRGLGLRC